MFLTSEPAFRALFPLIFKLGFFFLNQDVKFLITADQNRFQILIMNV